MNFLAHLYLSGDDPKIKVGNFIGDFVKGKNLEEQFEKEIAKGIQLHREIDSFTDRHAVVKQSKDRLRAKYKHYSGVITDIYFDHFLAKNWDKFSLQVLPDFAEESYALILSHDSILPNEVKYMMTYMVKGNWLVNYSKIEGIHKALSGMAHRAKFDSKMEEASENLRNSYAEFESDFFLFFPELKKFAENWLLAKMN